jgi:hypothetical protein
MYLSVEFALPFASALAIFCLIEAFCSAILGLFFSRESALGQAKRGQFLVSCFEFVCSCIFSTGYRHLNLATGLHKIINAVLYGMVQVPAVTFERCQRHGSEYALMCTPDLEPVFAQLTSGVSDLGRLADNWLNAVYVIVQGVLGYASHACDPVSLAPPFLQSGAVRASLFGANQTAVAGLTGWLMAVTDGFAIAYYGKGSVKVALWPAFVNVSHGLAAVTYAGSSTLDATSLSEAGVHARAVPGCMRAARGDVPGCIRACAWKCRVSVRERD